MPALIRTAYDGQEKTASESSAVDFTQKKDSKGKVLNPEVLSKTVQSDKDSTDINLIVKAARESGVPINPVSGNPAYGDFSGIGNYMDIKKKVAAADLAFSLYPADLRNRFDNQVSKMLDFIADPKNAEEAVALKLLDPAVILTELADDGKTRITKKERESLNKINADRAAGKQ